MTHKDDLLRLASRVLSRRDALRKTLDADLDSFRTVSEARGVGDQVDAVVDSVNDEICSQLVEIESHELGQIEHALRRIAAGVYLYCESCGQRIPAARLNALPYTTRCIDCQRESERCGLSRPPESHSEGWARIDDDPIDEGENEPSLNRGDFASDFREIGYRPFDCVVV
jgi:DnaK suppressor protein